MHDTIAGDHTATAIRSKLSGEARTLSAFYFGLRMHEALDRIGWRPIELSRATLIPPKTCSHVANGRDQPSLARALQMAEVVGYTLDSLCGEVPLGEPDGERLEFPAHSAGSEWHTAIELLSAAHGLSEFARRIGRPKPTIWRWKVPPWPEPSLHTAVEVSAALEQRLHAMALGRPALPGSERQSEV